MKKEMVYASETEKDNSQFIFDLAGVVKKNGFVIHNVKTMDMANSFENHGIPVSDDFDLHMIQICKPIKAAKSLQANPERAILMPKFIMTFTRNGKTQIRFLRFSNDVISALVDDVQFPASLAETYEKIVAMIEEAKRPCGIS